MNSKKLTPSQLQELRDLNAKLKKLQAKLLREAIAIDTQLRERVADVDDVLNDYEIELQVSFLLKEDDKSYKENEDNILTSLHEYLKGISTDKEQYPWRWEHNHNQFRARAEHPMRQDEHCWWFHSLYDHTDLEFTDMLRIGSFWSDIKVYYQYFDTI